MNRKNNKKELNWYIDKKDTLPDQGRKVLAVVKNPRGLPITYAEIAFVLDGKWYGEYPFVGNVYELDGVYAWQYIEGFPENN